MTNLAKHPWLTLRGSVYYLRAPVPSDIRDTFGKSEVTFSLRTTDRTQANKLIHGKANEVAESFELHRKAAKPSATKPSMPLPAIDSHTLQLVCDQYFTKVTDQDFEVRSDVLQQMRDDPQAFIDGKLIKHPTTAWYSNFFEELTPEEALLVCFNERSGSRVSALENALSLGDCAIGEATAEQLGLVASDGDRRRFARRLMETEAAALRAILAKDHNRYEQIVSRHKSTRRDLETAPPQRIDGGPTWDAVIADWAKAHETSKGSPKIRKEWCARLLAFARHCGVAPAEVTDAHVRGWRDKRLAAGLSPVTVGNSDIACIRVVFARAIREKALAGPNPAESVIVDNMNRAARKMKGFSNDEAAAILASAKLQKEPWKRWVPWLCAFTGSRVSTMMNLRQCDVKFIDGHHVVEVTKDAGPIKTGESERQVPIHSALIADGFLNFVSTRRGKRLFFDEGNTRRSSGQYNPGKGRCERLAAWVRSLEGIKVGREHGKDPSHAWRHWLKTALRGAGVADSTSDGITGHAPRTQGAGYGHVELDAKAEALAKVAVPQVRRLMDRIVVGPIEPLSQ